MHRRLAERRSSSRNCGHGISRWRQPPVIAETLEALDDAAASAQARGAPAAAAELLELAIALGGDSAGTSNPGWRGTASTAAEPARAGTARTGVLQECEPGPPRAEALHSLAIVRFNDDGVPRSVAIAQRALAEDEPDLPLRVRMLTTLAHALFNTGEPDAAWQCAERAVTSAERLGAQGLLSQSLGVRSMLFFLRGDGIDELSLRARPRGGGPRIRSPRPCSSRVSRTR